VSSYVLGMPVFIACMHCTTVFESCWCHYSDIHLAVFFFGNKKLPVCMANTSTEATCRKLIFATVFHTSHTGPISLC